MNRVCPAVCVMIQFASKTAFGLVFGNEADAPPAGQKILWKVSCLHTACQMLYASKMMKNNRDQFKRIFSFFNAVLLVSLYAIGFAWVWYRSYSDAILLPFYRRGNWVMILIYVILVLLYYAQVKRRHCDG